jgi:hypothetical protein
MMDINFTCQRVKVHMIKYNKTQYTMEYLNSVNGLFLKLLLGTTTCGHLSALKLYYSSTAEITYFRKGGNSVVIESDTNSHEECAHPLHQLFVVIVFI